MFEDKIITISPFTTSPYCGHPLIDDQFYFKYLVNKGVDFTFYTSRFSADLIKKQLPGANRFIKVINPMLGGRYGIFKYLSQISITNHSKVIIFLYTEELVVIFILLNIFKKYDLYLVSSNNISARRYNDYKGRLKVFFGLVNHRLAKLIVDSDYQIDLIGRLSKKVRIKSCTRKNHLMCKQGFQLQSDEGQVVRVSYFGPEKPEKPIELVLKLISADKERQLHYCFYNVEAKSVLRGLGLTNLPSNVFVDEQWKDYSDYLEKFKKSDIIFLTHTSEFEGKLSGNLCDCFALGVAYISLPIEPVLTFQRLHGDMGFICDPAKVNWSTDLLGSITRENIRIFKHRIQKAQGLYTNNSVYESLDVAFDLQKV
jgi:hypothetical protein